MPGGGRGVTGLFLVVVGGGVDGGVLGGGRGIGMVPECNGYRSYCMYCSYREGAKLRLVLEIV